MLYSLSSNCYRIGAFFVEKMKLWYKTTAYLRISGIFAQNISNGIKEEYN